MNSVIFNNGVQALANVLAYKPQRQLPCSLFCGNIKAVHSLQNATYKHNNDAPIRRICPLKECADIHMHLNNIVYAFKPTWDSVNELKLDKCLAEMQIYRASVVRNKYKFIDSIIANLAVVQLDVCRKIQEILPDKPIDLADVQKLIKTVNIMFGIFDLVVKTDERCLDICCGNERMIRAWLPSR